MRAAALPAGIEQLALIAALRGRANGAGASRLAIVVAFFLESAMEVT
jgi:hypothetical protein